MRPVGTLFVNWGFSEDLMRAERRCRVVMGCGVVFVGVSPEERSKRPPSASPMCSRSVPMQSVKGSSKHVVLMKRGMCRLTNCLSR